MSVRFLGRRVYLALVVVLRSSRPVASLSAASVLFELAIPARTLQRWRTWWAEAFVVTSLWRGACGLFMPPVDVDLLPASLLERFVGADAAARLSALLGLLTPLTIRPAEPACCRGVDHAA
jgi:hypothetical protein